MSSIGLKRLMSGDRDRLLERLLEGTSVGRSMVEEVEGERADERRRLAADLEKLQTNDAALVRGLMAEFEQADTAFAAAQAALQAAAGAAASTRSRWDRAERSFQRARTRILARLEETADPQVLEFLAWLDGELNSCRAGRVDPSNPAAGHDLIAKKLAVRKQALSEARVAAEAMRYSPAASHEIGEEIARIRAALPDDPGGVVGRLAGYSAPVKR